MPMFSTFMAGAALAGSVIHFEQPNFEAEARRAMAAYDATGFVATVMVDGEIVYSAGYGKIKEGSNRKVAADTLVPIASITKAFTTTALAILVDRGLVEWDEPIRTYIPEFEMYDPWVSEHFTVRDALTHRSGLPLGAGDLLIWPDGNADVNDIIAALPHLEPTSDFRAEYAYDNLLYAVAGEVVTRVSGQSWAAFVTSELIEPVGMEKCVADGSTLKQGKRGLITGHERAPGAEEGVPVDPRLAFSSTWAAAGGIVCSAPQMMKWAQFWFDGGVTASGKRLVSEKQMKELWTGVTPVNPPGAYRRSGASHLALYALGWNVLDFEGRLMVTHSGGAPGVVSRFILIPEEKIAIFAAANDYRSTPTTFAYQIADDLLDGRDIDNIAAAADSFAGFIENAKATLASAVAPSDDAAPPTLPLSAYAGTYRDAWYGDVTITLKGETLSIDMSKSEVLDGDLTHYSGNRFVAFWPDASLKADAFVDFDVDDGKAVAITMKAVSDITDFSYDFHDLNLIRVASD